jgi:hypothetical protein
MVADLEGAGRASADHDGRTLHHWSEVPRSLWLLGSPGDYSGLRGEWLTRPDYKGLLIAHIDFGGKTRSWGLVVGPRALAGTLWAPSPCTYIQVSTNAFFYLSTRD